MNLNFSIFLLIIGCGMVTFIPRVIPFLVIRAIPLPKPFIKWLQFIPICILTALVVNSMLIKSEHILTIDWSVLLAMIPTLVIALWTRSLSVTVVIGIIMMAVIRFF